MAESLFEQKHENKIMPFFGTNFKAQAVSESNAIHTQQQGFYDFYYDHKTSLNAFLMGNNVNQTKEGCFAAVFLLSLKIYFQSSCTGNSR
jgi:hypothetical protein